MTASYPDDLQAHLDSFHAENGSAVKVRFVGPRDRNELQSYVRSMSERCRYNRFLSALSELPGWELDRFVDGGRDNRFTIVATTVIEGLETIIGEASYAFDGEVSGVECGLSIGDRWQELGIGTALLGNIESRAALMGAGCVFGDILRSNKFMIRLANKCGYALVGSPVDWRLVRCEKAIRPCGRRP
jgi:RimJ/RimL family protein N-acetyltransferase